MGLKLGIYVLIIDIQEWVVVIEENDTEHVWMYSYLPKYGTSVQNQHTIYVEILLLFDMINLAFEYLVIFSFTNYFYTLYQVK